MPQMAPMSWLLLFMIFSATMIIFSILNYFTMNQHPLSKLKTKMNNKKILNWKW